MDLTNDSDHSISNAFGSGFWTSGKQGVNFSGFGAVGPATGTVYRSLRVGERAGDGEDAYAEPESFPCLRESGETNRIPLYFPAPPLGVDTLDLKAGVFGTVEGNPLE